MNESISYLESGEHLALFFAVNETIVVLHRDERRQVVRDGVVWSDRDVNSNKCRGKILEDVLCIALTA